MAFDLLLIMSNLVNLFVESEKMEGPKNDMIWHLHMKNTLVFNDLWKDICDGDKAQTKPTDARELAKWEA